MLLFGESIKTFSLDACQMHDCQIARPALVSGSRNWKKPYNKHLISLVFSFRNVNYGSSFFAIDLWPKREFTVRTENSANKRFVFIFFKTSEQGKS